MVPEVALCKLETVVVISLNTYCHRSRWNLNCHDSTDECPFVCIIWMCNSVCVSRYWCFEWPCKFVLSPPHAFDNRTVTTVCSRKFLKKWVSKFGLQHNCFHSQWVCCHWQASFKMTISKFSQKTIKMGYFKHNTPVKNGDTVRLPPQRPTPNVSDNGFDSKHTMKCVCLDICT